jgi:hypothetical protein
MAREANRLLAAKVDSDAIELGEGGGLVARLLLR